MTLGFADDLAPVPEYNGTNKNKLINKISDQDVVEFLMEHNDGKFDIEAIQDYINDDNKDYENYLHTKYVDARQRIYEVYLANKFVELYRIQPYNNFVKVTFFPSQEEYLVNIPAYFMKTINDKLVTKPPPFVYQKFPPIDPKKTPGVHLIEDEPLKVELDREFKYLK